MNWKWGRINVNEHTRMAMDEERIMKMKTSQHVWHCTGTPFAKIGSWISLHRYSFGISEPLLLRLCSWELAIALSQLSLQIHTETHTHNLKHKAPQSTHTYQKRISLTAREAGCKIMGCVCAVYRSLYLAVYTYMWHFTVLSEISMWQYVLIKKGYESH